MNNQLKSGLLLDENGELNEAGFDFKLTKTYSRDQIKDLKTRIKEWDYYAVLSNDYGICFTISDCSLYALASISILNFKTKQFITKSWLKWLTFGKINLPSSSVIGDLVYKTKNVFISFSNDGKERIISFNVKNYHENNNLEGKIVLAETTNKSMVISTPFNKKKHFYYNQKINNLLANGYFKYGKTTQEVKNYLAVLDWGRGVWTYKNTWYWASLSYKDQYSTRGFNLGYGFGDTSHASENMVFYNDEAYKLDDVNFKFAEDKNGINFSAPVIVQSKDKKIDLVFTPIIDRKDRINALVISTNQHQLFGYFTGEIKTSKRIIKFNNCLGFLEKVDNRW